LTRQFSAVATRQNGRSGPHKSQFEPRQAGADPVRKNDQPAQIESRSRDRVGKFAFCADASHQWRRRNFMADQQQVEQERQTLDDRTKMTKSRVSRVGRAGSTLGELRSRARESRKMELRIRELAAPCGNSGDFAAA